jgi:hypothetical protein
MAGRRYSFRSVPHVTRVVPENSDVGRTAEQYRHLAISERNWTPSASVTPTP